MFCAVKFPAGTSEFGSQVCREPSCSRHGSSEQSSLRFSTVCVCVNPWGFAVSTESPRLVLPLLKSLLCPGPFPVNPWLTVSGSAKLCLCRSSLDGFWGGWRKRPQGSSACKSHSKFLSTPTPAPWKRAQTVQIGCKMFFLSQ